MLSREGKAPFETSSGEVDTMLLPEWANQSKYDDIVKILNTLDLKAAGV